MKISIKRLSLILTFIFVISSFAGSTFAATKKPKPFLDTDVKKIEGKCETVSDYVKLISPTSYSWNLRDEASGFMELTMHVEKGKKKLGSITVWTVAEDNLINGLPEADHEPSLSKMTDHLPAYLAYATWYDPAFKMPTIRGIPVASTKKKVLDSYPNSGKTTLYTMTSLNPKATKSWLRYEDQFIGGRIVTPKKKSSMKEDYYIEYTWTNLNKKDEWREYITVIYGMKKDKVIFIDLKYDSDPE